MTADSIKVYETGTVPDLVVNTSAATYDAAAADDVSDALSILREPYMFLRMTFSTLAMFANLLSLFAIATIRFTKTTHLRLTISLCLSDLLFSVAVITYTLFSIFYPYTSDISYSCASQAFRYVFYFALVVTMLNLMAMALDHYLAILRPLHYPIMMTRTKAIVGIVLIWMFTIVIAFSDWLAAMSSLTRGSAVSDICKLVDKDSYLPQYFIVTLIVVAFFTMVLIYTKILIEIKKHRQRATNNPELKKNRKALITTLCIMGSFCVCWMPYVLFEFVNTIRIKVNGIPGDEYDTIVMWNNYLNVLVFLNALLDPIIYAIRMPEVQRSYLRLLHRIQKCAGKEPLYRSDTRTGVSMLDSTSRTTMRDSTRYSVCNSHPKAESCM